MTTEDKEWLEVVKEIGLLKDEIKKSAKNILSYLNDSNGSLEIDKEILEILNAIGKIGMYADNSGAVDSYAKSWVDLMRHSMMTKGSVKSLLIKKCLDQICMTSFWIKKRGKKFEIKIPDINIIKMP